MRTLSVCFWVVGLPQLVKLPELVGLPTPPGAEDIETFWSQANGFSTEIGVGDSGAFTLDLVKDGPHGSGGVVPLVRVRVSFCVRWWRVWLLTMIRAV